MSRSLVPPLHLAPEGFLDWRLLTINASQIRVGDVFFRTESGTPINREVLNIADGLYPNVTTRSHVLLQVRNTNGGISWIVLIPDTKIETYIKPEGTA